MSFYILKSTFKREEIGDVLLDKNAVESFVLGIKKLSDLANPVIVLKINMKSADTWKGMYSHIEEAKKTIKEILGDLIDDQTLNDMLPQRD